MQESSAGLFIHGITEMVWHMYWIKNTGLPWMAIPPVRHLFLLQLSMSPVPLRSAQQVVVLWGPLHLLLVLVHRIRAHTLRITSVKKCNFIFAYTISTKKRGLHQSDSRA